MLNEYKYSLQDLEGMIPWEREIYVTMLVQHIQKEVERKSKENQYG
jgi:hypothetical protein